LYQINPKEDREILMFGENITFTAIRETDISKGAEYSSHWYNVPVSSSSNLFLLVESLCSASKARSNRPLHASQLLIPVYAKLIDKSLNNQIAGCLNCITYDKYNKSSRKY